jgi:pantothenate kinase
VNPDPKAAITVSPSGSEIVDLARSLRRPGRTVVGITGAPGAGKSTLAEELVRIIGSGAVYVPMDGYHLADVELRRLGLIERKGAPETFDAYGYASLLERIRECPGHIVYAPGFERELEQPIAGSLPIPPAAEVVVTEGNYLLLDQPEWQRVRSFLDEVWFVDIPAEMRLEWLVERHIRFGKPKERAREWVRTVDEPNARAVLAGRLRAQRLIDLSRWSPPGELDQRRVNG